MNHQALIDHKYKDNTYYKLLVKEAKKGNTKAQEKLSGQSVRLTMRERAKLHSAVNKLCLVPKMSMRPCAVCSKATPNSIPQIADDGSEYEMFIHNRCLKRMAEAEDE
jgi:hypothetical protein